MIIWKLEHKVVHAIVFIVDGQDESRKQAALPGWLAALRKI